MKSNIKVRKELFILLLISAFFASCLTNVEETTIEEEEEPDACADITFSINVKPIIDANCIQCHGNGGNSPNLTAFSTISASAAKVKAEVASRRMPQGSSLTQDEIDAIVCWVDNGAFDN